MDRRPRFQPRFGTTNSQAAPAGPRGARLPRRLGQAPSPPPKQAGGMAGRFLTLVARDGLFFDPGDGGRPAELADYTARAAAGFRPAFSRVWRRLPAADRHCLRTYWRQQPLFLPPEGGRDAAYLRPRIVLADADSPDIRYWTVDQTGMVLRFPAALAVEEPDRLPAVIARALAGVYRYTTGEFLSLFREMVDGPLAQWEQEQGDDLTDDALDRKAGELEKFYLREFEAALGRILERWGVEE